LFEPASASVLAGFRPLDIRVTAVSEKALPWKQAPNGSRAIGKHPLIGAVVALVDAQRGLTKPFTECVRGLCWGMCARFVLGYRSGSLIVVSWV
jgi:hypothetical protein